MGQYFLAINTDKRQYVCPWCVGGGAKLWEWAANSQAGLLVLLLRQSSGTGGGDWYGYHRGYSDGDCRQCRPRGRHTRLDQVVGSWAGDRVALVGDYDHSDLFDTARRQFTNISRDVGKAFNAFVQSKNKQLELHTCDSCAAAAKGGNKP